MMKRSQLLVLPVALAVLAGCASTGADVKPEASAPSLPAAPAKPVFLQTDLMGRDAKALDDLLGAPALIRREGEGEFRRYALADCALIIILYPDETGKSAAAHLDSAATRSGEAKPDLDQCLARGLAAK